MLVAARVRVQRRFVHWPCMCVRVTDSSGGTPRTSASGSDATHRIAGRRAVHSSETVGPHGVRGASRRALRAADHALDDVPRTVDPVRWAHTYLSWRSCEQKRRRTDFGRLFTAAGAPLAAGDRVHGTKALKADVVDRSLVDYKRTIVTWFGAPVVVEARSALALRDVEMDVDRVFDAAADGDIDRAVLLARGGDATGPTLELLPWCVEGARWLTESRRVYARLIDGSCTCWLRMGRCRTTRRTMPRPAYGSSGSSTVSIRFTSDRLRLVDTIADTHPDTRRTALLERREEYWARRRELRAASEPAAARGATAAGRRA